MKKLLLILLFTAFAMPCLVSAKTIEGKVVDRGGAPISHVTIILQEQDSTYVSSAIADSKGGFVLHYEKQDYRLILQHLQYNSVEIVSSKRELGAITMTLKEGEEVGEVVVRGERPMVMVTHSGLSYAVQQIIADKVVTSAYDALLELPGMSERNGELHLAGAAGVTVIFNGFPTSMGNHQVMEMLKQMPASIVERADVMYSTPPQFHVRGAAINIAINSMEEEAGSSRFQGEVRGGYTQHHYANYLAGLNMLYSTNKFSVDAAYTYSDLKTKTGLDLISDHTVGGILHKVRQANKGVTKRQQHTTRVGLNYKPKESNLLSLVYNSSISRSGKSVEKSLGTHSNSHNVKEFDDQFHNIALDYSSGAGFKAGVNYTYFKNPSLQNFIDNISNGERTKFASRSQQEINSILLYADQSHSLSKNWTLNYGAKFSYANDYDYQLYDIDEGGSALYNTDKTIKEYLYNIYMGVGKSFSDKLSMHISLAGERYELAKDVDWGLFPQANLTYMHSPMSIYQFSFSSDKQYPSYWEKQDYKGYLNGYAVIHGNPDLRAFNTYSAQFAYIKNQKYIFSLYYVYQPNSSAQLGYQSKDELTMIYKTQNWDYNQILGVNVEVPFVVGKWLNSRLSVNAFYQQSKDDNFFDISFNNEKFIGNINLDNTINVSSKPNIKLNLRAHYMTEPIQGIMNLTHIWGVDVGAKWSFAKNKAELNIKANDIFNSSYPDIYVRSRGQNFRMNMLSDTRSFHVSLSYKFGGYQTKKRKEIDKSRYGH